MKADTKYILIKHPRFGLCNKIINWAKATVWAKKNNASVIVIGWTHLPLGSIFRGEKTWRWYKGYFKSSSTVIKILLFFKLKKEINNINQTATSNYYYTLKSTPLITDLIELSPYRNFLLKSFYDLISSSYLEKYKSEKSPVIGVHIRRGDFVKNGSAVNLDYYIQVIKTIRFINGNNLPVTVFSDGHRAELNPILQLNNVEIFDSKDDLIDLLTLSKSKILITSIGSSYSYWAAFMNNGVVIHHPKSWVPQCRPVEINKENFEGLFCEENINSPFFRKNIQIIF